MEESDGDVEYSVTTTSNFGDLDAVIITMKVYDAENNCVGEDTIRLIRWGVGIIATPPVVMADAKADIPIAFTIRIPSTFDDEISKDKIKGYELILYIVDDSNQHQIDIQTTSSSFANILEGNHANSAAINETCFTLMVNESKFDAIDIYSDRVDVAYYVLKVTLDGLSGVGSMDIESAPFELDAFFDNDFQCLEWGVDEVDIDANSFKDSCWQESDDYYQLDDECGTDEYHNGHPPNMTQCYLDDTADVT